MTKFKVGDKVIADGDEAVITQIILPDDRNWDDPGMPVWYAVEWPTNEWGTFSEDELRRVGGGMNERIRELAEQATKHYPETESSGEFSTFDKEKFAELIVKECGKIVSGLIVPETFEQDIGPYEKWNQALGHAALEIEQHFFGVKE